MLKVWNIFADTSILSAIIVVAWYREIATAAKPPRNDSGGRYVSAPI